MTAPRDLTGWRAPGSRVVVLGPVLGERPWWMRYPWSKTSWWHVRCDGCGHAWMARRTTIVGHGRVPPMRGCLSCANRERWAERRSLLGACSSAA